MTRARFRSRLVQARRRHDADEARVSFMELFFDLVFVLVVTELAALLLHDLSLRGVAKMLFLLLLAWWAWIYTTWTTNWFDPDTLSVRLVLLVGMLASMLGAISIPDAFGARAALLVVGYVGLQVVRNTFVLVATERGDPLYLPLLRFWRWNAVVAVVWLAGAFLDDGTRVAVWIAALVLDYTGPFVGHWLPRQGRTAAVEWQLVPSHFAERLYLFVIIALGESIFSAGITASRLALTPARLLAVVVSLLVAAAFWWLYFDYHAKRAQEELAAAGDERGRLGRDLTYVHIPIVAGIIVAAVASELVVAHPGDRLPGNELAVLAAGPAVYLLGGLALKVRVLGLVATQRLAATALIGGAVALGAVLPALAVWSLVAVVGMTLAALETQERFRDAMQRPI
jgi:low temperature requirement protein LtrA